MRQEFSCTTPAASNAISTDQVRTLLRVADPTFEAADAYLETFVIHPAVGFVETETNQTLLQATYETWWPAWPTDGLLWLPRSVPLASVTHLKYYDSDDDLQTVDSANYEVVSSKNAPWPSRIAPMPSYTWPAAIGRQKAIYAEYVAGVATVDDLDPRMSRALAVSCVHMYENLEPTSEERRYVVPDGLRRLLDQLRCGEQV